MKKVRNIVVASDSFKGSLSSAQVADAVEKGILSICPECQVTKVSVADGGEGTVEALVETLGGRLVEVEVHDPLMRPVRASYGLIDNAEVRTAVLEMSSASGLPLLAPQERNPWLTTTRGTGELIMDAMAHGCRKFLVGIGGSATNDAGTGMLAAMGFRFLDASGREVEPCGGSLGDIVSIDTDGVAPAVFESEFIVACDVDTPFCGPQGAAYVFAPQKGASPEMVRRLDEGMASFADAVTLWKGTASPSRLSDSRIPLDFRTLPGSGAAGGLGGGFSAFLNASLVRGVDMVLDAIGFDALLEGADLVITGEGKIDSQTSKGKTPYGVLLRAQAAHVPAIAIGGCVEQPAPAGFAAVLPVVEEPFDLVEAMKPEVASRNVEAAAVHIMNLIKTL